MCRCGAGRTAAADDGADVSDAAAQSSGISSYESPLQKCNHNKKGTNVLFSVVDPKGFFSGSDPSLDPVSDPA